LVQELKKENKAVLGLTGTFGSGKTTAANFFEELGAFVIDSDRLAHEALLKGSPVYTRIADIFGKSVEEDQSGINRKWLAGVIFTDGAKRKKVESIIHPYVFSRIEEEIQAASQKVVVVEVPLLFETGFERFCDDVLVVTADEEVVKQRLKQKGFNEREINERVKAQMPVEEKMKKANAIIDNSKDFKSTRKRVEEIYRKYQPLSKGAK